MTISAPTFVQPLASDHTNGGKLVVVDVTITSYTTGGEAFDIKQLGLSEVWSATIAPSSPVSSGITAQWHHANKKIVVYSGANAEVANGTLVTTLRATFYGLSS